MILFYPDCGPDRDGAGDHRRTDQSGPAAQTGQWGKDRGDVPFGFDLAPGGRLVKNDTEQRAVRLIRNMKGKGESLRSICRELEARGHRTKTGKAQWSPKIVASVARRAA